MTRRLIRGLLCTGVLALGSCNIPGRAYPVAPAISGVVLQAGTPVTRGEVRRTFRSRDVPTVCGGEVSQLGPDGRFRFDSVATEVAGREYGKSYFVSLCLQTDDDHIQLWFHEYDRRRLPQRVFLRCELLMGSRESELPCELGE